MGILSNTDLEFVEMREEEGGVHSFAFKPLGQFRDVAGQHGLLKLPGVGTKAYSLASAPGDPEAAEQSVASHPVAAPAPPDGQRGRL